MAKQKAKTARVVLFQGTFQVWNAGDNKQAIKGFRSKIRPAAVRAARKHGLEPILYGRAKQTLRVA